jgi:hypothetical protein
LAAAAAVVVITIQAILLLREMVALAEAQVLMLLATPQGQVQAVEQAEMLLLFLLPLVQQLNTVNGVGVRKVVLVRLALQAVQ